jgi:hypothetical protein
MTGNEVRDAAERDEPAKAGPVAELADDFVSTEHVVPGPGGGMRYTATAGRVVLREEAHTEGTSDGVKPKAEVFLVSYVAGDSSPDGGPAPSPRPVTFAFNVMDV